MRNEWYCVNDPGWHNAGMLEIWRKKKVFVAQCKTTILCEELLAELTNHLKNHDQLRLTVHYTAVHCNWSIKSESINWLLLWKDRIVPHSLNWDKYWNVHDVRELIITLITRICWMVSEQLKGHKFYTEFNTFNCNCQHQMIRISLFQPSSHIMCPRSSNWNHSQSKGDRGGGGKKLNRLINSANHVYSYTSGQWVGFWLSVSPQPFRPPWLLARKYHGAVLEGEAEAEAAGGGLWLWPQVPPV